jgi:GH25 family lysozyme M1 (1,4-beta-N-acetylmuramidase)
MQSRELSKGLLHIAVFAAALACFCETRTVPADVLGIDVSDLVSVSQLQCLKSEGGFTQLISRAYRSTGQCDPATAQTIVNAWSAGFTQVDVYHFPSMNQGAGAQINASIACLNAHKVKFSRYWLDIEIFAWPNDTNKNVAFIKNLVDTLLENKISDIGIYTSHRSWPPITGNSTLFAHYPNWYAHYQTPPQPNFNDFVPFGGWTKPFMKQYQGDAKICGIDVDTNWRPT